VVRLAQAERSPTGGSLQITKELATAGEAEQRSQQEIPGGDADANPNLSVWNAQRGAIYSGSVAFS